MDSILTQTYLITPADTDRFGLLRPDRLLTIMQDLAGRHAQLLGIGMERMLSAHNSAWMLMRNWFRLSRPLRAGEELRLETWPQPTDALTSNRTFYFYCNGERIGEAFQVWVLVDVDKRRIKRIRDFPEFDAISYTNRPAPIDLRRLRLPEMTEAGTVRVEPEDIDSNGHMNNARYLRYVMQVLEDAAVLEAQINYDRECRQGDCLRLQTGGSGAERYVTGQMEDGSLSFESKLILG